MSSLKLAEIIYMPVTHYDNLQVKRNASQEVIKGAYRHLSQKWHPDKNPDDRENAEMILKIINSAYEVLSDTTRRKQYDEWIEEQEKYELSLKSQGISKENLNDIVKISLP